MHLHYKEFSEMFHFCAGWPHHKAQKANFGNPVIEYIVSILSFNFAYIIIIIIVLSARSLVAIANHKTFPRSSVFC